MIGNHLKLGILSDFGGKGTTNNNIYFPVGLWCDVFNVKGQQGCIKQTTAGTRIDSHNPWEFYLSLREGSIIPIQDNKQVGAHTIIELQSEPVDLHILPNCTDTTSPCTAQGLYYNDDGETLNTTEFNQYHIQYSQPQGQTPATLTLTIANKQQHQRINANDDLGGVEVYYGTGFGWTTTTVYTVTATLDDGSSVQLSDATYVEKTDRVVYNYGAATGEKSVSLYDLATLTFQKKA